MGEDRSGRGDQVGGRPLTGAAARVVPNVPAFSVDAGFWYSIPGHLAVEVGSQVRVPLSGRKVRGWVVEIAGSRPEALKDLAGVSGAVPVLDRELIRSLEWAAHHYVAPLAVVLAKASPPNLPKMAPAARAKAHPGPATPTASPLHALAVETAEGRRFPTTAVVGAWQDTGWLSGLGPVLGAGKTVMLVAATAAEVEEIGNRAGELYGDAIVMVAGEEDAVLTGAWEGAQTAGRLVVGTPRLALWKLSELALAVVLEEGRRAMKDRQTPTIHVRDMLRTRSLIEGFNLVFFGPTPSVELLAAGSSVHRLPGRPWGLVEVVDRSGEPPGAGLLSEQVVAALKATAARAGERAFVLTGHKIADRMVEEVNTRVGRDAASIAPGVSPISVGAERDLPGLGRVALTVAPDVDFLLEGTGYRASEEALRVLARLGNVLAPGAGKRMMVQTRRPTSPLITALRRGDPVPYLERVLADRAKDGLPPSVEMLAVEIRGEEPEGASEEMASFEQVEVLGPMRLEDGRRWLVSGELAAVRHRLRTMVGRWRDKGATVRVDADPIDF